MADCFVNNIPGKSRLETKIVKCPNIPGTKNNWKSLKIAKRKMSARCKKENLGYVWDGCWCMLCGQAAGKHCENGGKLITCNKCNYKVHSACLKIDFLSQIVLEQFWRCERCVTCVVCHKTSNSKAETLITCCVCVDAYHFNCHTPRLLNKIINIRNWECAKCQQLYKRIGVNNGTRYVERKNRNEEIPDVREWSSKQIFKYMEKQFPSLAHVFLLYDIDGASLLLMKRSFVLKELSLKLGPALNLYNAIVRLQSKSNDPTLCWM